VVIEGSGKGAALLEGVDVQVMVLGDGAEVSEGSKPREDGEEGLQETLNPKS